MNTKINRVRGVTVELLDMSGIHADALAEFVKSDPTVTSVTSNFAHARATTPDGKVALFCDEGVGDVVGDGDDRYLLELFAARGNKRSMLPSAIARLTAAEIAAIPSTGTADLADFIRTFGDRLEQNFSHWHRTLTA